MKKTIFVFSALIIALLILFQLGKYSFISGDMAVELIIALIAIVFLFLGFYLNHKTAGPKEMAPQQIDAKKIKELGISQREYEVLIEISHGLSNKEIGQKLFISESTIKTHVSSLFMKLNAKRRTQAIQRAKELRIITP